MAENAVDAAGKGGMLGALMMTSMMGTGGGAMGAMLQPSPGGVPAAGASGQVGSGVAPIPREVFCSNCSKKYSSSSKFCPHCGDPYVPCPRCGADNDKAARRCVSCGTPLESAASCPKCGMQLPPGAVVCPRCARGVGGTGTCAQCGSLLAPGRRILLGMREEGGVAMQTKSEISRLFILLHLVGIALLVLAFFLLVPSRMRELIPHGSTWLSSALSSLSISRLFAICATRPWRLQCQDPCPWPAWLCDIVYHVLALGLVFYGVFYFLPFRVQLVGQMGLLFAATTIVAIAWWASAHAVEVAEEEHATRSGLEELKAALSRCEAELSTKAPIPQSRTPASSQAQRRCKVSFPVPRSIRDLL